MPKISKERLLARERGIVQAAARCLQRKGLEGTGMRDLFRAANLSPGAVYRYFSSKEDLLAAVAAASPGLVEAALAQATETAPPARRLRRLLEASAAGPPAARLQLELETAALRSPAIAAALRKRRAAARRALAEALAGPPESTDLVLSLCEGLARRRLLAPEADLTGAIAAADRLLRGELEEAAPGTAPPSQPAFSG